MAYNNPKSVIAFLFFTLLSLSLTYGSFIVNNDPVVAVRVRGVLYCTVSGNPIQGVLNQPLAGANVTVYCNGGTVNVGNAITDLTGTFDTILSVLDTLLFDNTTCLVEASVANVLNCNIYPPHAVLRGNLDLLGTTIVNGIGLIAQFKAGEFQVIFNNNK